MLNLHKKMLFVAGSGCRHPFLVEKKERYIKQKRMLRRMVKDVVKICLLFLMLFIIGCGGSEVVEGELAVNSFGVTVDCVPANPSVGGTVSCDLQLSRSDLNPTLSSATFSISLSDSNSLSASSNFLTNLPTGFTSIGSFENGFTISTTSLGSNPSSLGTLNFDVIGSGFTDVNLNFIAAEDDIFNNVLDQFSSVTSGRVTVG
jgi:hypothetical protein